MPKDITIWFYQLPISKNTIFICLAILEINRDLFLGWWKKKLHLSEEFFSVTSNHSGGDFLKVTAWQLGSFHPSGNNDRDFGALDLSVVFWKTSPVWFPSLATLPSLKSIKPATRHNFDLMLHGEFWRTFVMGIPKIIYIFPPSWQRVPRISYDFGLNFWTHLAYAKSILSSSSSCKTHHRQATCLPVAKSQSEVRSDVLEHKRWSNHLWAGYSMEVILNELRWFLQCHIIKLQDD